MILNNKLLCIFEMSLLIVLLSIKCIVSGIITGRSRVTLVADFTISWPLELVVQQ